MKFLILFLISTSALATEVLSINRTGFRTNPTNARQLEFLVSFSARVFNVQTSDFQPRAFGNLSAGQVVDVSSMNDQTFKVTVRYFDGEGRLSLYFNDSDRSIVDFEDKPLSRSVFNASQSWTVDNVGPRAISMYRTGSFPNGNQYVDRYTIRFSEPVRNVASYHFQAFGPGVYVRSVYGSGSYRTIDVVKRTQYQVTNLYFRDSGRSITDNLGNRRRD